MRIRVVITVLLSTTLVAAPLRAQTGAIVPAASSDVAPVADAKAAKAAAKAEAKRQRDLVAKYGMGPYPDEITAYVNAKPEALRPLYRALYTGGERNAVLNFERLGLAAYQAGQFKDAGWAFDQALNRIETIYADNPQAATARSVFHNEANKDFKGEPYERAMAYYYRGLIYLQQGNYPDATVSFKNAEYQDTLSEEESFQSDFAVMNYLRGWSQKCAGDTTSARESFDLAMKAQKGLTAPAPGDNVLFVAELGNGPVKARDAAQAQKLVFQPGAAYDENAAAVTLVDGKKTSAVPLRLASSVQYQATTRGGRAIDGLMNGKANWKEGTDAVGTALAMQGLMGNGGVYSQLAGSMFKMFSGAMKTNADIRAWEGLPDLILVGSATAKSPSWKSEGKYLKDTAAVDGLKDSDTLRGGAKACSIVWMRSRPGVFGDDIVGEDAGVAAAQNRKKPVQVKNKAFRTTLEGSTL
ncbi:hypothetical protein [Novosphingobium sp. 9]|uniref:hypothetical protein n=1 Tax=Novosphingobium sp. 9 TaxID=2025349 RepID=UPI0021B65292|nr:hypothetical protein [Novosphingobium sp. 9]